MLFGNPQRALTSRSGSASPEERNALKTREECTTDFTRYGSRGGVSRLITPHFAAGARMDRRTGVIMSYEAVFGN